MCRVRVCLSLFSWYYHYYCIIIAKALYDHLDCLSRRLILWKEGEIDTLLSMIQTRLTGSRTPKLPNRAEIFTKLVIEGRISSALRYLSEEDCGGVLPSSDDIMRQLTDKHPSVQEA